MGKRDQNRIEQRARILESASRLFAAEGFDQVTVAHVARHARVARATVFNYFPSKHALVDAISADVIAYYGRMVERALENRTDSTPTLLRALFDQMGEGIEHIQQLYRGVFREIIRMQIGIDEGGLAMRERDQVVGLLSALLRRGQERGEITRDHEATEMAHAINSLSSGTLAHWLYEDSGKVLRERLGNAMEIFLGSVALDGSRRGEAPLPELGEPSFGG